MQNFYLSLNCRGTKVWTSLFLFSTRCLIPQTDQTQNDILINVINASKHVFPYSQEMSFHLSVKPREYKELLRYNSWRFCLHRNTVVKIYVWWINLLIFKLVVVVSPSPRVLLMCLVKTIHTNLERAQRKQLLKSFDFPEKASCDEEIALHTSCLPTAIPKQSTSVTWYD